MKQIIQEEKKIFKHIYEVRKMKKNAFTLIEIMVVMTIIGIVMTFGINAFRHHDKGTRYLYSNIYNALDRAVYNATNFTDLPDPFRDTDENSDEPLSETDQVERLCRILTEYIDPIDAEPCSDVGNRIINLQGITAQQDPENGNLIDTSHTEFTTKLPMFTATNGVSFYITSRQNIVVPNPQNPEQEDVLHHYFFVFADTNNVQPPNTLKYERGMFDPDIFAFAVLDIGRVCPLGPPEIDDRYMLTRIAYQVVADNRNRDASQTMFSSPSQPYFITKAEALGYYLPAERNGTDTEVTLVDFIDENPYTYNDLIRDQWEATMIYSSMPSMEQALADYEANLGDGQHIFIRNEDVVGEGAPRTYGCTKLDDEACTVSIDRYIY